MGFLLLVLGPAVAAWLLAGLAAVIVLPIGREPRRLLHGEQRSYWWVLLGPMAWYAIRRRLTMLGGTAHHPDRDPGNPIAALGLLAATGLVAAVWAWRDYAGKVAWMVEQGEYAGWNDYVLTNEFHLLMRLAPLALVLVWVCAVVGLDLGLMLARMARRRSGSVGSATRADPPGMP